MPATDGGTLNDVHDALSTALRRHAVQYLVNADDDVASIEDLADYLGNQEDIPKARERNYLRLHHMALPTLAAKGFIDYDERNGVIRYREHPVLEQVLQRTVESTSAA